MKLIERYALSAGLKIGAQHLKEDFYPLPFMRYITLHAGSGMLGKNYPFYAEVMRLIKPHLIAQGIEVVQLGGKDDAPIDGAHHIMGKCTLNQSSYVLHGARLHLGNDSVWGHRAGYLGIPLVQPFGSTDYRNHASYEADPAKTVFLESHRWGRHPTFASQENPPSIALIRPEEIAEAVLRLLGIAYPPFTRTQFIGLNYLQTIVEVIPNMVPAPDFMSHLPLIVRMDYTHDEAVLQSILQTGRRIHLFARAPINVNLLVAFKGQILSYNHEIDTSCPVDYLQIIARIIPARAIFSRTEDLDALAALRFQFFNICSIDQLTHRTKAKYVTEAASYLNISAADMQIGLDTALNSGILSFRTNKYLLSRDKVYLSYAHHLADQSTSAVGANEGRVIDREEFWRETNHHMIYA